MLSDFPISGGIIVLPDSSKGVDGDQPQSQLDNWILPSEAFQPRHEIKDRSPPPEQFTSRCFTGTRVGRLLRKMVSLKPAFLLAKIFFVITETQMEEVEDTTSALLCLPSTLTSLSAPCWSGVSNAVDMLYFLADEGDVQTSVSLLLVLGDKVRHLLNESAVEHWFLSYIDALCRCRLWNTAALVVKLSQIESVQHRFSLYPTHCNMCNRALQRRGWICDACKTITNTCSLCHLVVRGLYVWCRGKQNFSVHLRLPAVLKRFFITGCSHGGHLMHMKEWFARNAACPTGCGHICEYDCVS